MDAIVLDGNTKQALAMVRSLGRAGVRVSVGADRKTAMALHSKYAADTFVYPSAYTDQHGFIVAVKTAAKRLEGKPLVFAGSDATYLSLFAVEKELAEFVTLLQPSRESVEIAFNKAKTYELAESVGIGTIPTDLPHDNADLKEVCKKISFPAVVKTRHSVAWKQGKGVFGTASFVHDAKQLEQTFYHLQEKTGEYPLVQQFIKGEEYGVEMLTSNGQIFATVVHRRIRSMSPTGGASVVKETVSDSPVVQKMKTAAEMLVQKLSWTGPIMVEFKVDAKSDEPLLMEINGRWWGSLPLAIAAGVDFPLLALKLATGELPSETRVTARPRVVTRHWLGDVRWLLRVWLGRDPMRRHLYPGRFKALREFLFPDRAMTSDVYQAGDRKPSIMEYVDVIIGRS